MICVSRDGEFSPSFGTTGFLTIALSFGATYSATVSMPITESPIVLGSSEAWPLLLSSSSDQRRGSAPGPIVISGRDAKGTGGAWLRAAASARRRRV